MTDSDVLWLRRSAVLFGLFLQLGICFGQHQPLEFGNVPLEDLKSNKCEIDSGATAVILFDVIQVDLTNHKDRYVRHARIKFFKPDAINSWSKVNFLYDKNHRKISGIQAATYNLVDGQMVVTNLNPKNIFETKVSRRISKLSFAMPQVSSGSIIEFSYTISANYSSGGLLINGLAPIYSSNLLDFSWQYQHDIPTYWSEYTFQGGFRASFMQGEFSIENKQETKNGIETNRWTIKNVPAFHEESNSLPKSDLIGKMYIDFSERTWGQIGTPFMRLANYGMNPKDSSLLRQLADKFETISSTKVKLDSIVRYVKRKLKWNRLVDQYPDREFGEVFISGNGSSCEINLVMMALLKKAGLSGYPVVLSTRNHGTVRPNRPRATQFNDLIIAVAIPQTPDKKEEIILLDGTDRNLSNEYIPMRCLNGYGLMIDGIESKLIPLNEPRSKTVLSASLRLDESKKEAEGALEMSFSGLHASNERSSFDSLGQDRYEERLSVMYPSKTDRLSVLNLGNSNLPLKMSFKLRDGELSKFSEDHIYLDPFVIKPDENRFKSASRIYPVDLNPPQDLTYMAKIELPEKYLVEELPKSAAYSLPNNSAKFSYNIVQHDTILYLTSQLMFNRVVFQPEEYASLKEFYSLILSKQSEPIVLKRKTGN